MGRAHIGLDKSKCRYQQARQVASSDQTAPVARDEGRIQEPNPTYDKVQGMCQNPCVEPIHAVLEEMSSRRVLSGAYFAR